MKQKQDTLSVGDTGTVKLLPINAFVSGRVEPLYTALQEKHVYSQVNAVNSFAPTDPKLKYQYMRDLEKGLPIPSILYTCSYRLNYHYLWKIPEGVTIESATNENMHIISQIKEELPSYHSRALKRAFIDRCGLIAPGVKSHVVRQIYRELTGIVPSNTHTIFTQYSLFTLCLTFLYNILIVRTCSIYIFH